MKEIEKMLENKRLGKNRLNMVFLNKVSIIRGGKYVFKNDN